VWLVRIASGLPTRTKPLARCPTTGPTFPWHAIVSKGGECGCTGQQFEMPRLKLLSLACRGRLLVLHEGVCLMTAHTRLAFHEWIRLQLCHLIGVTGVACA